MWANVPLYGPKQVHDCVTDADAVDSCPEIRVNFADYACTRIWTSALELNAHYVT